MSSLDSSTFALKDYSAIPGPHVTDDGVLFRVWAPHARTLKVVFPETQTSYSLVHQESGYCETLCANVHAGQDYYLTRDGIRLLPDPASRFQPRGINGPSRVIDLRHFPWNDQDWQGLPLKDLAFYELHVGTFSSSGSFRGVEEKLGYLKSLGINAIQLMPIGEFPGTRNWGYDNAAIYAPSHNYGTPEDLCHLVDAAHQQGIAVFLDVVYNHFSPEGSYANEFADFFTAKHASPWGRGINLDDVDNQGVRDFFIGNALMWLREYHFDGLRLDATHALKDDSDPHFLAELSEAIESLEGYKRWLIAEDDRNLAQLIRPRSEKGYGLHGVWADDFHHQVRNLTAHDTEAYYTDFANTSASEIVETLRQGWFYTGHASRFWHKNRGTTTDGLELHQFVHCIQNHDQVGNRPLGDRINHSITPSCYRAISALLLLSPATPLIFMGQEWASNSPFLYFTDHPPELGRLVTEGRRREFNGFAGFRGEIPDPQSPATFEQCKLDWHEPFLPTHSGVHRLYTDLLYLRKRLQTDQPPSIQSHGAYGLSIKYARHVLLVSLAANQTLPLPAKWRTFLHTEDPRYTHVAHPPIRSGHEVHFAVPAAFIAECAGEEKV